MIDIDANTIVTTARTGDQIKREKKLRTEVWELPDGRLHERLWIISPSSDPEYIGATRQAKNRMGTFSFAVFAPR